MVANSGVSEANITVVQIIENKSQFMERSREEPLQVIEDLEFFLRKQGCVIQRTSIDISPEEESNEEVSEKLSEFKQCQNSAVIEQLAKIQLLADRPVETETNEVTVNKGAIVDQNVGISGEVYMVTPPKLPDSSRSQDKSSSSVVYIGGVHDEDIKELLKSVDIFHTVEEDESGPSSITLSICEKPPSSDEDSSENKSSRYHHEAFNSFKSGMFVENKPLMSPGLLLQWRVRPPEEERENCFPDEALTPTSSMFSSAYTVTELSCSDTSYDRSPPSEYSTLSSRRTSEDDENILEKQHDDESLMKFYEYLRLFRQLSAFNDPALTFGEWDENHNNDSCHENLIDRGSRGGSNRSIVFSYIPCRDQREKEEEELWVANEAAFSMNLQSKDKTKESEKDDIEVHPVSAVNIFVNHTPKHSAETFVSASCQTSQQQKGKIEMITAATQTVYSCLAPPTASSHYKVEPKNRRSERSQFTSQVCMTSRGGHQRQSVEANESSVVAEMPSREVSDSGESCSSAATHMATLLCPSINERRHFSARQRISENDVSKLTKAVSSEKELKENNQSNIEDRVPMKVPDNANEAHHPVASSTNQPTKRFSFLIRNNQRSDQPTQDIVQITAPVSASDRAILARLAELKLSELSSGSSDGGRASDNKCKKSSSVTIPSPRHPNCTRCHEPVYHQERLQPSKGLVYHSSCFKCHQCGVRLNLNTFCRNPLILGDCRIYCRSHVPSLDPGKVLKDSVNAFTRSEALKSDSRKSAILDTSNCQQIVSI